MRLLLSLAIALSLPGCATWSTSRVDTRASDVSSITTSAVHNKAPLDSIRITEGNIVDKRYALLGDIAVNVNKTTAFHPNPTTEMVNDRLKEKAHELGADAVIFVRYGKVGMGLLSWGSLEGKGRAIRYIK